MVAPSVGVALYRITQEALANAAQHAPHARTALGIEVGDGRASLIAETTGPTVPEAAGEAGPTSIRPARDAGARDRARRRVRRWADANWLAGDLPASVGG